MELSTFSSDSTETLLCRLGSRLGFLGLMLFAFFAFLGTAGAHLGLVLMVVALLMSYQQAWPVLSREPMCWVIFFGIIYVLLRTAYIAFVSPELNPLNYQIAWDWLRLSLFFVIAWFLRGSLTRIKWFLLLSLLGLLLGVGIRTDWTTLWPLIGTTHREGFGWGINTFGLFSVSVLLGLIVMGSRLLKAAQGKRLVFISSVGGWLLLVIVMLQMSLQTGTKGAWLAGVIVLICTLILLAWKDYRDGSAAATLVGLVVVAAMFAIIALNVDSIGSRLSVGDELKVMFSADALEDAAPSSVMGRVYVWHLAVEAWSQAPFFGLGSVASSELIANASNERMHILSHFHNMYLEVLVAWGLVGAIVAFTVLVLLFRSLWNSYYIGVLPLDYALLIGALLVVWLLWGFTEFRMIHVDGMFHWYLIAGLAYAVCFHRRGEGVQSLKKDKTSCVE